MLCRSCRRWTCLRACRLRTWARHQRRTQATLWDCAGSHHETAIPRNVDSLFFKEGQKPKQLLMTLAVVKSIFAPMLTTRKDAAGLVRQRKREWKRVWDRTVSSNGNIATYMCRFGTYILFIVDVLIVWYDIQHPCNFRSEMGEKNEPFKASHLNPHSAINKYYNNGI